MKSTLKSSFSYQDILKTFRVQTYILEEARNGVKVYSYRVICWVPPSSGFELAEQNAQFNTFKSLIKQTFDENSAFFKGIETFRKGKESLILRMLVIDTDKPFRQNKKEIINSVRSRYPEAHIISYKRIKTSDGRKTKLLKTRK